MDKIDLIIQLYKSNDSDFTDLTVLIDYSDILFTKKETDKLVKFYDVEFDKNF